MNITIDTNGLRVYVGSSYLTITRTGGFHLRVMRFHLTVDAWLAPVTRDAAVPFVDPEPFMQAHPVTIDLDPAGEEFLASLPVSTWPKAHCEPNPFLADGEVEVLAAPRRSPIEVARIEYEDALEMESLAYERYVESGADLDDLDEYLAAREVASIAYRAYNAASNRLCDGCGLSPISCECDEIADDAYRAQMESDAYLAYLYGPDTDDPIIDDFEFDLANADRVKHGRDVAFYGYC